MTDVTGPPSPQPPAPAAPVPGKTLGIVALILAFFVQIVGLILGIVALVQSRRAGVKNTPAVWAIVLSAVFMVIGIIIVVVLVTATAGALASACAELGPGIHELADGTTITCG